MIRVARTPTTQFEAVEGEGLQARYQRLCRLLKGRVSTATLSVFSEPRPTSQGNGIDWVSDSGGQPVLLNSLPGEKQTEITKILHDRLENVIKVSKELEATSTEDAEFLRENASYPSPEDVYVLNDQPVVIGWGLQRLGIPSQSAPTIIKDKASLEAAKVDTTQVELAVGQDKKSKKRTIWTILLALLILLGIWFAWSQWFNSFERLQESVIAADCEGLKKIRADQEQFDLDDIRYVELLKDVDTRLADCEYNKIKEAVEDAEGNCVVLIELRNIETLMSSSEDRYVELKNKVEKQILDCSYEDLKARLDGRECKGVEKLLSEEAYLVTPPDERFAELKKQAISQVAQCNYERVAARVDDKKDNCEDMQVVLDEEETLQQPPEERFQSLRDIVDETLLTCRIDELEKKVKQADCKQTEQILNTEPLIKINNERVVVIREAAQSKISDCRYEEVKKTVDTVKEDCKASGKLLKSEPLLHTDENRYKDLKKILEKRLQVCLKQQAKNALEQCAGERPPELAPELVVVLDQSGSMKNPMAATPEVTRRWENLVETVGPFGLLQVEIERAKMLEYSPSRMKVAKNSVRTVVESLPSDVQVGLVEVSSCTGAISHGFFAANQRARLIRKINQASPKDKTPLADGVRKASKLIKDVDRPSIMVVVSDGEESCEEPKDVCAAGRRLATSHPKLTINVVDIMGAGGANCLAASTGGKVFTANSVADVASTMEKAASKALGPQRCRSK